VRETPAWYRDAKFGIMTHWGLYSVPGWAPLDDALVRVLAAGEDGPDGDGTDDPLTRNCYAEWYQNTMALDGPTRAYHRDVWHDRDYGDFRQAFNEAVARWDPASWAELFAESGAKYVVPVTKHHDGFLLWPSTVHNPHRTDWATARDVVGELGDAVRASGMRYGLYYSGGLDWTFGPAPIRRMRDVESSGPTDPAYARYADAHWRELITRYRPSILWNDINYPAAAEPDRLIADYYAAVPDGIVNDRFRTASPDIRNPEYRQLAEIDPRPWETVRGAGISFGWNRQETEFLSVAGLVGLLVDVVSKNGNLLLGVTPDDRGRIPGPQQELLRGTGEWLALHGEAIYGTRPWHTASAETTDGEQVWFTTRGDTVYGIAPGTADPLAVARGLRLPEPRAIGTDVFAVER
jgi:alpha-L-fucosidase